MYGCESWTVKKAEHWRIDAFELWYWRRLLRVPWTASRSNQSILTEISPECSLEGLMLKLKLQYFGHLMRRTDSFEKTLMLAKTEAGGEGDDRGWDGWMASPTQWTWVCVNSGCWWWTGRPGVLQSMGLQRAKHDWVTDWTNWTWHIFLSFAFVVYSTTQTYKSITSWCSAPVSPSFITIYHIHVITWIWSVLLVTITTFCLFWLPTLNSQLCAMYPMELNGGGGRSFTFLLKFDLYLFPTYL